MLYENFGDVEKAFYKRLGKIDYLIRRFVGFVFSFRKSSRWFNVLDRVFQHNDDKSRYCGIPSGRKHYFGECYLREDIFPFRKILFCDIEAPVFNNVDSYIKTLYGDYMTIPPVEKREKHYIKELDLSK